MTVNLLDILIIVPLLLFAWNGYRKGLIIEIASLAALVLGLYAAFFFSDFAAKILNDNFNIDEKYIAIFAFLLTLIVIIFFVITSGKVVQKFVEVLLLGFINKLAGGIFGLLKGALILSMLIFVINYFNFGSFIFKEETRQKSILFEPIESIAPLMYSWLDSKNFSFEIPDKEDVIDTIY
ncbi:MAG: CvpA family protein [Bacteroidetes bacterium]|nr:CvpA family protein [Bacteroidota bacterium]